MRFLTPTEDQAMMEYCSSALRAKEPRTPNHTVTLGKTTAHFLNRHGKRLNFIDRSEFSHFFSLSQPLLLPQPKATDSF